MKKVLIARYLKTFVNIFYFLSPYVAIVTHLEPFSTLEMIKLVYTDDLLKKVTNKTINGVKLKFCSKLRMSSFDYYIP